jgi:hypothetical protein
VDADRTTRTFNVTASRLSENVGGGGGERVTSAELDSFTMDFSGGLL